MTSFLYKQTGGKRRMSFTIIFTMIYLLIAFFAATMTYFEQQETGGRSTALKYAGFMACLLWPVTFVFMAITMRLRKA
jgi:ABC-type Na+ efflux pump permease subunit